MTLDDRDIAALAYLAGRARPHGARRWDPTGTAANIAKVRDRTLASVILATIRAAADRDCETPGVIPTNGSHWAEQLAPQPFTPQTSTSGERCSTCDLREPSCRARWGGDHEFESAADAARRRAESDPSAVRTAVAALREDMPAMREPDHRRGLDDLAVRKPELKARVDAVRATLPAPQLREPEEAAE